jgi:putative ABC transport system ATP-binding protein
VRGLLAVAEVRVVRDGRAVVDGISMSVRAGEMVGVAGPSGSGKTTLLAVLAGLSHPDAGSVLFDGARPGPAHPDPVGVVLQGYGLVPVLTALENVEVALQHEHLDQAAVAADATAALTRVGLGMLADRLVDRLSGGQQQRVAVARALVTKPRLLVADEPTSELDEATRDQVLAELRAEADRGAVVVIASHDLAVLERCDRTVRLGAGRAA